MLGLFLLKWNKCEPTHSCPTLGVCRGYLLPSGLALQPYRVSITIQNANIFQIPMFICSTLICGSPHPQHVGFAVTIVVGSLITIDAKRITLKLSPFFPTSKPGGFLNGDLKIQVIRNGNTQILSAVFAHLFQLDPSEFSPRRRRGILPAYLPPSRWSVATRPPAPFRCPPPGYHLLQMCGAATSHC